MKKVISISICIITAMIACQSKLYFPSKESSNYTILVEGRTLYIQRCGSCHNLYLPKDFSSEQWKETINKMQERAKINDEEKKLITDYILHTKLM